MHFLSLLAQQQQTSQTISLVIAAAIVVLGLFVYGIRDVGRFSLTRAWAISGVSFRESIRRRVLLITPLAMIAVVVISQLTRPFDEQDAIRQTAKFCLFATGMLIAIVTIILAASNLPKEIENRVIYTIATKPVTRLEIILGKVIGFARVSATILLIMGVFTWGYLHVRSWALQRDIRSAIEDPDSRLSEVSQATLQHYQSFGLLTAKSYETADAMGVYARPPQGDVNWLSGSGDGVAIFRFDYPPDAWVPPTQGPIPGGAGWAIVADVAYEVGEDAAVDIDLMQQFGIPTTRPAPRSLPTPMFPPRPRVQFGFHTPDGYTATIPGTLHRNGVLPVPDPKSGESIVIPLTPEQVTFLAQNRPFSVGISGATRGASYKLTTPKDPTQSPLRLELLSAPGTLKTLPPTNDPRVGTYVSFRGREGTFGQQLRGGGGADAAMGVYTFRDARPTIVADGKVPFEMRIGIERSASDEFDTDNYTTLELRVREENGQVSDPQVVKVESNRNIYFQLPQQAVQSGNFDLLIRNTTNEHWIGLLPRSIQMVTGNSPFAWNLFKSLTVLWLMSILVIIVAIFCSTFLSWPIAVVLSVVILLGHWGVQQVAGGGGALGNQVANDLFPRGATPAAVVSNTVNALNTFMETVGSVLPDISQFAATEELERGVSVPLSRLTDAAKVAFGFGIPLIVLAYIFLRNKEVAP